MNHPKDIALIAAVCRRWEQSRVVSEYHYAHRQEGEFLSFDDLRIAAPCDPDSVKPS